MAEYAMIIHLLFFVFLLIVYVLVAQFVTMVQAGDAAENLSEGMTVLAQYDADRYILLMFHAPLIQRVLFRTRCRCDGIRKRILRAQTLAYHSGD
ncbi:MAG: hypothetical protein U9Q37_07765 [Euryarchaeota archaeon]|nr:hypothetical protein [Euryarchaeota archaeon]